MAKKIRSVAATADLAQITLPRVGSIVTIVAVTNTGYHLRQPARVVSTHTRYIVARAIPPEGDIHAEEYFALQQFSKATLHRVRHDGSVSVSEWLVKEDS